MLVLVLMSALTSDPYVLAVASVCGDAQLMYLMAVTRTMIEATNVASRRYNEVFSLPSRAMIEKRRRSGQPWQANERNTVQLDQPARFVGRQ